MKKNLLVGAVICLAVIALFLGFGKSLIWNPKLDIAEDTWDFGAKKIGSELKHTFMIKNTGSAQLTLYAYPSCPDCIVLQLEKSTIPPKSETKLHVKLIDPEEGPYTGYIMLDTNDPRRQAKKLTVKGTYIK